VRLEGADQVKGEQYKFLTMLRQAIGMVCLTFEALQMCPSDIFVDTTGLAYSFWVVK